MILIVGQNPGNNPKAFHYKNHTIDRLHKWCDELGIKNFSFMNCVQERGNVSFRDVEWNVLEETARSHDKVIALGSFASSCLDRINISHFKLPHPSPRNRLMNDKEYVTQTLGECKDYINE